MLKIQEFDRLLSEQVKQSKFAMYNRQALFMCKMIIFKQSIADIREELKSLYGADYTAARGFLSKELKSAENACNIQELHLIITSAEKPADIMRAAAVYMEKNQVNYRTLFKPEKPEKKTRAESIENFINSLSYSEAVTVKESIEKRLDYLRAAAEKAAAEKLEKQKAAEKAAAEKLEKQKAAAAKKAENAEKRAAAEKRKLENLKKQAQAAAEKAEKINAELLKRLNAGKNTAAALEISKKQGIKAQNAKRRAA